MHTILPKKMQFCLTIYKKRERDVVVVPFPLDYIFFNTTAERAGM